MVSTVSPQSLHESPSAYGKLIDVRSAAEFNIGHIAGAINVPMEQVNARLGDIGKGPVLVICEAGARAAIVAGWLADRQPVSILAGGTAAWRNAGYALVSCACSRWSLERQVRFAAGILVLVGTVLGVLVHPAWVYLAMFIGAGLTFAGATNICGMAVLLGHMPWNRRADANVASVTSIGAQCRL
jgi:rhodanese-related sulfurtransferase